MVNAMLAAATFRDNSARRTPCAINGTALLAHGLCAMSTADRIAKDCPLHMMPRPN